MLAKLVKLLIRALLPVASTILVLAGIVLLRAQMWPAGTICTLLAMAGFILSARLLDNVLFTQEELESLRPYVLPAVLWTVVISLLLISVFHAADDFVSPETDRIASAAWVGSIILGMIITWRQPARGDSGGHLLERIITNRRELLLVLLLLTGAFLLRTIGLSSHPYPWSGDEASIGMEALRILRGQTTNFFDTGWSGQPNWSFVPTAAAQIFLGNNILAIRSVSVLAGTLAVLFLYLAGRELFNPVIALMATAFLATLPYHLHFSRLGVYNIADSLMSSAMFWLLARGFRTDDPRDYYSAGMVAGLSIYTYAGTRLVPILGAASLCFVLIRKKGFLSSHRRHLLSFLAAAAISAAPQAAFFVRHPAVFFGRLGQEGILFNGWLPQHAAQTGNGVPEILWNQFTRTITVFIASSAPGNFFNSPDPYLTILASVLFLLGMGYALAYLLDPRYFSLLIWFWSVILLGGVLTLNPPANTRLLMTTPVIALWMALGAYKILEYLQKFNLIRQAAIAPLLTLLVCAIAFQNIGFYMFEYRTHMYFQDANGEYAMETSLMARELGKDVQIFILGAPRVFSSFPTFSFIVPDNPRSDLYPENIASLELPPAQKVIFFAIPENRSLLAEISQKYPGGAGGLVYRKVRPDEILFEYYILPP